MTPFLTKWWWLWVAACYCLHCWPKVEEPSYDKVSWNVLYETDLEDKVQSDVLVGDIRQCLTVRKQLVQVSPMINGRLRRGPAFSTCLHSTSCCAVSNCFWLSLTPVDACARAMWRRNGFTSVLTLRRRVGI